MKRPLCAFRATVFELEGRALQATLTPPPPSLPSTYIVGFGEPPNSPSHVFTQEVGQQSRVATVLLARIISTGPKGLPPLQVQVKTDPSSPYVGLNVGAVNQTVTFAPGQALAVLTVPIIAGAPNPGEVDVNLTMTPIDPSLGLSVSVPVDTLRILASDASIPPTIVASDGTPQGIELFFNKPMDPVQASNVKNYAVSSQTVHANSSGWPLFPIKSWVVTTHLLLKSAEYDAATNTVTLTSRRPLPYRAGFVLTQGRPAHAAGGPKAGTAAATGLVDLEGHPINQNTNPGKFTVNVNQGYSPNYNFPGLA